MLPQTTTTNHYHNWGVNIYYHTNFCSNPTIFQFYHKFYHTFLPQILQQILPQTSTTNHYHNWGLNIYYHTNLCTSLTIFQFYHTFYHTCYHKNLPQTTTTISTETPQHFLYQRETHTNVLRGLQIFLLHPIRLSLGRK